MRMSGWLAALYASLLASSLAAAADDDWTSCPPPCKCKWFSGRKMAECVNGSLSAVPSGLSAEIQTLDLSGNAISALRGDAFRHVRLVNLHKLFLRDCGIVSLGREAFRGLEILIELDLSRNKVRDLLPGTFRDNGRLRIINLNHNLIQKLGDNIFSNLPHLQTVELSHCQLTHIAQRAFVNVPNLQTLRLDSNKLVSLRPETLKPLERLKSLVLHNNPWRCDCHLSAMNAWTRERNLYTPPTACAEPEPLRGKLWSDLAAQHLACAPRIVFPAAGSVLEAQSTEVNLHCRAEGDPTPVIHWVYNARIITNETRRLGSEERAFTLRSGPGGWLNLTLYQLRVNDRGDYTCVAKSSGGLDERIITLVVPPGLGSVGLAGISVTLAWILLLGVGAVLILCIVVALSCWFCRSSSDTRERTVKKSPSDCAAPNGKLNHKEVAVSEQEKSLIKKVNPVQKPPRCIEATAVVVSSSSVVSDMKTTLLDNTSVKQAPSVASSDFDTQGSSMSSTCNDAPAMQNSLNEGAVHSSRQIYPPDLLSFPSRNSQAIPNPNIPFRTFKNSQLSHQQSPVSPTVSPNSSQQSPQFVEPLPHSHSQSSLSTLNFKLGQPHRTGFVTLPRNQHMIHRNSVTEASLAIQCLREMKAGESYLSGTGSRSGVLSLNRNTRNNNNNPVTVMQNLPLSPTAKRLLLPHYTSPSPIKENIVFSPSMVTTNSHFSRSLSKNSMVSPPMLSPDLVQINPFLEDGRANDSFIRLAPDGAPVTTQEEILSRTSTMDYMSASYQKDLVNRNLKKSKVSSPQSLSSNIIMADPLSRTMYQYDKDDGTAV